MEASVGTGVGVVHVDCLEVNLELLEEEEELLEVWLVVLLLFLIDTESLFLTASGRPSHLELTLGTPAGSLWVVTPGKPPTGVPEPEPGPPRSAACFRCWSAYCSKASCEGSFRVRKPKTPLPFFFFGALESCDEEALEARLDDATLRESKDGRLEEDEDGGVMDGGV